MAKFNVGDRFEFIGDPVGNDAGRITPGTVVTVREVVRASEIGAHDDSEDSVVVEWSEPALGLDDEGAPAVTLAPRAWSVGVGNFPTLFSQVKE